LGDNSLRSRKSEMKVRRTKQKKKYLFEIHAFPKKRRQGESALIVPRVRSKKVHLWTEF